MPHGGQTATEADLNIFDVMPPCITDLMVIEGAEAVPPEGYTRLPVDLNKGTTGPPLWLSYRRDGSDQSPRNRVTALGIVKPGDPFSPDWIKDPTDLNKGTGRNPLHLVHQKGEEPVRHIEFGSGAFKPGFSTLGGFNEGTHGGPTFILYRQGGPDVHSNDTPAWEADPKPVGLAVTGIEIVKFPPGEDVFPIPDAHLLPHTLNEGAGDQGTRVLVFRKDRDNQNPGNCITGLRTARQDEPVPEYWTRLPTDINEGTGRAPLYLMYRKGEHPIIDLQVIEGRDPAPQLRTGFRYIDQDLNQGAGGAYLYLAYRQVNGVKGAPPGFLPGPFPPGPSAPGTSGA